MQEVTSKYKVYMYEKSRSRARARVIAKESLMNG